MSDFLDRVDMALMNGGIVSDPLVENFVTLISEAMKDKNITHLERWTSDEHNIKISDYPHMFFNKVADGKLYITRLSDLMFGKDNKDVYATPHGLDGIALVSDAIAKLYDVDLAEYGIAERDLDLVAHSHAKELSNFHLFSQKREEDENKPQALKDDQYRQSTIKFLNDVRNKSKSGSLKGLVTHSLKYIQKKGYGVSKEPEEELEPETEEDWVGQDPEDEDWVGQDPEEEGWVDDDDDDFSSDEEAIRQALEKRGIPGPEEEEEIRQWLAELEAEEADEDPPETPQDVADLMDPDDPGEALRQKVARRDPDLTTTTRMEPRPKGQPPTREPEEEGEEHGLDIKVRERGEREPELDDEAVDEKERIAKDRIQILRSTDDQVLIRVKAMKRDKPGGKLFRTYRFITIDRDDVDDWSLTGMWEYLKNMSSKAQSDPEYAKQFKSMYSVNLKNAYRSFDKPAANFEEYLKNFNGGSPSERLMRAYSRNDPYDQYRLSGAISSLDDNTVQRIFNDLKPRMVGINDTVKIVKWLTAQLESFKGRGLEEGKEITNEATLRRALLVLKEAIDYSKDLIELGMLGMAFNTIAKEIMRNPSMLKRYGVDVPDYAKTRDKRFKQWYKQEVGKGNISRMTPEREAQYQAMFKRQEKGEKPFQQAELPSQDPARVLDPEPWEKEPESDKYDKDIDDEYAKSLQKKLASSFSRIVANPDLLKAFRIYVDKEGELGNLTMPEYETAYELINATTNDTLAKYLNTYRGSLHTLERIIRLARQI